jgi:hypothetical protein
MFSVVIPSEVAAATESRNLAVVFAVRPTLACTATQRRVTVPPDFRREMLAENPAALDVDARAGYDTPP